MNASAPRALGDAIPLGGGVRAYKSLEPLLVPADQVRPHPENANNGDIDSIMASIKANYVYRPVYAQVSTGYVLAGNSTYAALMELEAGQIPVLWLDVDDATARRILAGDNQIARLARMDVSLELQLLQQIEEEEGLFGTGYEPEDVARLMEQLEEIGERELHVEFDAHQGNGQPETRVQCPSCGYEWRLGVAE